MKTKIDEIQMKICVYCHYFLMVFSLSGCKCIVFVIVSVAYFGIYLVEQIK